MTHFVGKLIDPSQTYINCLCLHNLNLNDKQVCITVGCIPPACCPYGGGGLPNPGGVHPRGVLPYPRGSASRGCASRGVCPTPRGVCPTWGSLHSGGSAQPQGVCIQGGQSGDLPRRGLHPGGLAIPPGLLTGVGLGRPSCPPPLRPCEQNDIQV